MPGSTLSLPGAASEGNADEKPTASSISHREKWKESLEPIKGVQVAEPAKFTCNQFMSCGIAADSVGELLLPKTRKKGSQRT